MRKFDLVLTGKLLPGFEAKSAAPALAAMLRVPEDKARELLAGTETVIKRGITEEELPPYVEALRKCGAEVRAREPAPDTIKCPACGAEQPPRNLCRQCGADMKRVAMAQEAAKKPAAPVKSVPVASAAASFTPAPQAPLYRRSWWIEFLFFFFLTPYWAWKTMLDPERGKLAHFIGGLVLVGFCVQLFLIVNDIRKHGWLGEDGPVFDAVRYAGESRQQVDAFVAANQRLPERGEIVAGERPRSVDAVDIGPRGRVRVVLSSELERSAGGSIVLTPVLDEQGGMAWQCRTSGIEAPWLAKNCAMD